MAEIVCHGRNGHCCCLAAEVKNGVLVIQQRHHGEKHLTTINLRQIAAALVREEQEAVG